MQARPPRVQITYDVEVENSMEKRELPFVMAVISDLYGQQEERIPYDQQRLISINRDNFDSVMKIIKPMLSVRLNNDSTSKKDLKPVYDLVFTSLKSFTPDEIILQIPEGKLLIEDRKYLVDLLPKIDSNALLAKELTEIAAVDKSVDKTKAVNLANQSGLIKPEDNDETKANKVEMILAFDKHAKNRKDEQLHTIIMDCITKIDLSLSEQMDEILHNPEFQALEARWLALHKLVHKTETGKYLEIKLLNASSQDIYNDLHYATELTQSRLFKWIYEDEYGTMGGIPYSCIVFDEYFGKSEYDTRFLTLLSQIGSAAHTCLLASVKPEMFEIESFNDLHIPRDLSMIFESSEAIHWNSFRKNEESRYINLFLPRILMRTPYGPNTLPTRGFMYAETVAGHENDKFCWGNPAFAMAIQINLAVAKYGWAAAIRGPEGGGLVENLPTYSFKTQFADIAVKCPTQTQITDRRELELSNLGFISLCHKKMTDQAVFFSSQSTQKAKEYEDEYTNANAKISARMPYILNASRFAHYIKVIMRDKIGSFQSAGQIEYYLQEWIARYVLLSDEADQDTKAEYPLREAEIIVTEIESDPGQYEVKMRLRPHFQLEGVNVSLRFVAKIARVV